MSNIQYSIVNTGEESFITVFVAGRDPLPANSSHPNYDAIVQGALADDPKVVDLFDVASTAARHFDRLSERVTARNGRIYLDGDEIDNSLTTQIVRFLDEDVDDWKPLVAFFENVQANPTEHSREQLFTWLNKRDFTITPEGNFVGYKGVKAEGDSYVSITHGPAIVNGEPVEGAVPNPIGGVIEMARGQVAHDPSKGCSTGLHVGSFQYAKSFSQGAVLEVHVNPRDVVSVPTDSDWAKVRTCRYTVVRPIDAPYTSALLDTDYAPDEDDEDEE